MGDQNDLESSSGVPGNGMHRLDMTLEDGHLEVKRRIVPLCSVHVGKEDCRELVQYTVGPSRDSTPLFLFFPTFAC